MKYTETQFKFWCSLGVHSIFYDEMTKEEIREELFNLIMKLNNSITTHIEENEWIK